MKRLKFLMIFMAFSSLSSFLFSEEKDLYEYNNIVSSLSETNIPQVQDNYIIFTTKTGPRFAGIAFDFENYNKIHPFEIHKCTDLEGNTTSEVMFYLLERPKNLTEITYRLIIDGLWTKDPENPDVTVDEDTGITLSHLKIDSKIPEITQADSKSSNVKFIYRGEEGQSVRLAGNFTSWDSWIYELEETSPGFYELSLPLPNGKYYYNYYLGMNAIVDKTNPNRSYTREGKVVSVIEVN